MKCKDCIHNVICSADAYFKSIDEAEKYCCHFKDKSRYIELPCKVGDTFYCLARYYSKKGLGDYFVDERQVSSFEFDARGLTIWDYDGFAYSENVFFTREEAEAKLKEMQG